MHQPGKFKKPSGPSTPALPPPPGTKAFFNPETFHPLHDLVLLKLVVDEEPLIHLPQSAKDNERRAVVEKVGPGRITDWGYEMKPIFKSGDHVYLAPGAGFPLEVVNKTTAFIIARPNEILGIFHHEESAQATEGTESVPLSGSEGSVGAGLLETPAPTSEGAGADRAVA